MKYICFQFIVVIEFLRRMHSFFLITCFFFLKGETSSGKSSIINEVLNAEILPTGICATTTRICRIKHSEEMVILTRDERDERDITQTKLTSTEEMADKLETLAKTDDPRIGYVDICMPFPFEQVQYLIY